MDGIVPDFILRSRVFPVGNYGTNFEFRPDSLEVRPESSRYYSARPSDAVALAVAILTAYAPEKLASSGAPWPESRKVQTAGVLDPGTFAAWLDEPERAVTELARIPRGRLKGAFVNVVEGSRAATVAFGDLAPAEAEADRLATSMPGALVLTLRIESARVATVTTTTTVEKD